MKIVSYKQLIVWQRSITLVGEVYRISEKLPKSEIYILVSQMLRAAISIPSNIAEGYRRNHQNEYIHFLSISLASAAELETQLIIAHKQYKVNTAKAESLVEEIQRMLYVIIKKLKSK